MWNVISIYRRNTFPVDGESRFPRRSTLPGRRTPTLVALHEVLGRLSFPGLPVMIEAGDAVASAGTPVAARMSGRKEKRPGAAPPMVAEPSGTPPEPALACIRKETAACRPGSKTTP
jgi:hypothetical protein